jgi:hypothetical protein
MVSLGLQNLFKGLLLHKDSLGQQHELLSGFFPDFFPAGKFNLDLMQRLGREIPVFSAIILNKKETHFSYFNNSAPRNNSSCLIAAFLLIIQNDLANPPHPSMKDVQRDSV